MPATAGVSKSTIRLPMVHHITRLRKTGLKWASQEERTQKAGCTFSACLWQQNQKCFETEAELPAGVMWQLSCDPGPTATETGQTPKMSECWRQWSNSWDSSHPCNLSGRVRNPQIQSGRKVLTWSTPVLFSAVWKLQTNRRKAEVDLLHCFNMKIRYLCPHRNVPTLPCALHPCQGAQNWKIISFELYALVTSPAL